MGSKKLSNVPLPPREASPSLAPMNGSFRDPGGRLVLTEGRALRVVYDESAAHVREFLSANICLQLVNEGSLIRTSPIEDSTLKTRLSKFASSEDTSDPGVRLLLEHEHIGFPSYPYEWPEEMLYAAGELTLDLLERLLPEEYGLKDASPYNVLYRGSQPVFVDLLSIERRSLADPTWLPYAQFARTFIRPLMAKKYFGIGLDQSLSLNRDGLYPQQVFHMCSVWQKMRPPFLTLVSLPTLLSRLRTESYRNQVFNRKMARSPEQAQFILGRQVKGLRRKLHRVKPDANRQSIWSDYETNCHAEQDLPFKRKFVAEALDQRKCRKVLDVGCNRGQFSMLAARKGISVVAIDRDPVVVGRLWSEAQVDKLDVLPLVVDLTRPTPSLGWRNQECRSFLDRAIGAFDCVLMLAVIHHMLVTERIPLDEILALASELSNDMVIVEYIAPDDPMFRLITRGYDHLYESLTRDLFEAVSRKYFVIEKTAQIGNSKRWLYQMRSRRVG